MGFLKVSRSLLLSHESFGFTSPHFYPNLRGYKHGYHPFCLYHLIPTIDYLPWAIRLSASFSRVAWQTGCDILGLGVLWHLWHEAQIPKQKGKHGQHALLTFPSTHAIHEPEGIATYPPVFKHCQKSPSYIKIYRIYHLCWKCWNGNLLQINISIHLLIRGWVWQ